MVKAYSDLSVTTFESSSWFFKGGKHLENMSFLEMRDAADELYACLKDWKANINDCMKEETNRTPHGLSLQYVPIPHPIQYFCLHWIQHVLE